MLYQGASSFWETSKGSDDFAKAGSLGHGWSAIPVYFYHAYLLGIGPLEAGFRSFCFDPGIKAASRAESTVSTPYGEISVKWQLADGNWSMNSSTRQLLNARKNQMGKCC